MQFRRLRDQEPIRESDASTKHSLTARQGLAIKQMCHENDGI